MKRRAWAMKLGLSFPLMLLVGSLLTAVAIAAPPNFSLADQFERKHSQASIFNGRPVVMVGGDERKTRFAIKKWVVQLDSRIKDRARLVGLVNLEGLPFFIPDSSVRNSLRQELPKLTVLCDWDGVVYPKLGFGNGSLVTVRIFTAEGTLLGSVQGVPNDQRLAKVLDFVQEAEK